MADDLIVPISDEQAKLGQEAIKAGVRVYGDLRDILGDLPKDLVGILVGDPVKALRAAMINKVWNRTKEINEQRGVDPQTPSPKLALPILAAAANETSDELQDLWARLLAAAMDPHRAKKVRQAFIEVVKKFDPLDALTLVKLSESNSWSPNARDAFSTMFGASSDEIEVSFRNLMKLDLAYGLAGGIADVLLTATGRELARVLN